MAPGDDNSPSSNNEVPELEAENIEQQSPEEELQEDIEEVEEAAQRERVDLTLDRMSETDEEAVEASDAAETIERAPQRISNVEELVRDLDINLEEENQESNVSALESSLFGYIVSAQEAGNINMERAQTDVSYLLDFFKPKEDNEKEAVKKTREILENQTCRMYPWLGKVERIVSDAQLFYKDAIERADRLRETRNTGWEEFDGKAKTMFWVAAGGIAGAWVINKLWKKRKASLAETEQARIEAENDDLVENTTLLKAAGALSLATLGYKVVSGERLGNFMLETFGVSMALNDLKEVAALILSGRLSDAWNELFGNFEVKDELTLEAASVIDVDPVQLMLIEDKDYSTLISWSADANRTVGSFLFDHMPDPDIPFAPSPKERLEQIETEKKVARYLSSRRYELDNIDPRPKTIRDALEALKRKGILTPSFDAVSIAERDQPEEEIAERDSDGVPGLLEENMTPHINAAIDKWQENGSRVGDMPEMAAGVVEGAKTDGAVLVMHAGVVGAWHSGKFVVISTINSVTQTFLTLAEAPFSEDVDAVDALETYWDAGGMYYIIGGAGWSAVNAGFALHNNNLAQAMSGVRQGVKIATAPFQLTLKGANATQSMYRGAKDMFYEGGVQVMPTRYQKLQWMYSRTQYQAELYMKYYDIKYGTSRAAWTQRKLMGPRLDTLLQRHGANFSDAYREFNQLGKVGERIDPWGKGSEDRQNRAADKARQFRSEGRFANFEIVSESEAASRARLLSEQRGGTPEQYLDEAREMVHTEKAQPLSKYATHAEATAAGAAELSSAHLNRLSNLGVTEQAVIRMRQMNLSPQAIERIISQLEPETTRASRLRNLEWIMMQEQAGPYWRAFSKGIKVLGVLGAAAFIVGFNKADDKFEFMTHALAGAGVFMVALAGTERATVGRIPNPIIQQVAAFAGALLITIGADIFWDSTGGFVLEKYTPDRQHTFASERIGGQAMEGLAFGSSFGGWFDILEFAGESIGIGKKVKANTDPIAYLQDTVMLFKTFDASGWDETMFEHYNVHTVNDLETYSAMALEDKVEELDEFLETYPDNPNEEQEEEFVSIKRDIAQLQSFVDGTWVDDIRMGIELREQVVIIPAEEEFRRLASAKFPDGGLETFNRIMTRMENQEPMVENEADEQVWEFLMHEETEVNEVKLSFRDFTANRRSNVDNLAFLDKRFPPSNLGEGEEEEMDLESLELRLLAYEEQESTEVQSTEIPVYEGGELEQTS